MNAKAYLDIRKYKRAVQSLELKCAELRHKASGVGAITYDKDRVQTSPQNMMEKVVADLVETEQKYLEAIQRYYDEIFIREMQIAEMDDSLQSDILRMRYLEGSGDKLTSYEEIAVKLKYKYGTIKNVHWKALRAFEKKYLNK